MGRRAKSADKSAPQRVAANVIRERRSLIRDRNTLMRLIGKSLHAFPDALFCNGPLEVNPFLRFVTAGSCFCTGSALGCRLMVFEEERAGPILDARGCPGFSPSTSCRHCGLTQSIVPAGTPLREGWCYPARKPLSASPFVSHLAANSFFVRLNGVSPPRPAFSKAPRAVAVNIGRRPPP